MPRVLAALLLVNLFFISATLVAAGTVLALGTLANESGPLLADSVLTWIVISVAGAAAAVGFMVFVMRLISRPRARAPARAQA